jgi:hypothetical protein
MPGKRGNPKWCSSYSLRPTPNLPTEFELRVKKLGLSPQDYVSSLALKSWCKANRNHFYVPEWLLKEWGITVELSYGNVA